MNTCSLWCDFIERNFLQQDFLQLLESADIKGATSNPSIFEQALQKRSYAQSIDSLRQNTRDTKSIYEQLAVADIKQAAQILRPLYNANPQNGWVSLEIDPFLCDDAQQSLTEGKRLFSLINEPNVMIKVPATEAGYDVMQALFYEGISVNATLVFSPYQTQRILKSLEHNPKNAQAVISVFVSRFDRACPTLPQPPMLGITNAVLIYRLIQSHNLAHVRTLFASTGVKASGLAKDYYICSLLFENSINTAPLDAIEAFLRGSKKPTPQQQQLCACTQAQLEQLLSSFPINLTELYDTLFVQGIKAFKDSFSSMLTSLR